MNRLETNLINLEKVQIESLLILILVRKLQTDKNIQNFLIQTFTLRIDVVRRISKGSFMSAGVSDEII